MVIGEQMNVYLYNIYTFYLNGLNYYYYKVWNLFNIILR